MAEEYVIGIDSGTQSTRAILFNLKGEKIASASATHPALMTDERGLIVHDYQDVYQGLCTACQILIEKIKKNSETATGTIKAIGIAAQRATVFFLDKEGQQLCRPISWMDRSWQSNEKYSDKWKDNLDAWQYFLVNYSRMNWMQREYPDIFEKVEKYFTTSGYIHYKLTGEFADSLGNNLGMPVDREHWNLYQDSAVYEGMAITRSQLATFRNPG